MQRFVDICLPFIFIVALMAVPLASPNPLARDSLCEILGFCISLPNHDFWNTLAFEFGLGASLSIVFYWLLVKLPDNSKRRRLRNHLNASYTAFRREITLQFLFASGQASVSLESFDDILSQEGFSKHFKQASCEVKGDKWHDVQNNITDRQLIDIGIATSIFRDDLSYVLNNSDIGNQRAFDMLHRLTKATGYRNFSSTDYDDQKSLFGFYWQIMAGWDPVQGYPKNDAISRIIDQI